MSAASRYQILAGVYRTACCERDDARYWARKMKAERDAVVAEKRRLYAILLDWGNVCRCGAVLLPDERYLGGDCPKCGGVT